MGTFKYPLTGVESIEPIDPDLAEQAVPGHGVPSQDPDNAAQVGLSPQEAEREAKSAFVGGGALAGMAAGAAAGAVVAGPLGVLVGGTVGTLAGALGGEAAGSLREPETDDRPDSLPSAMPDPGEGAAPR